MSSTGKVKQTAASVGGHFECALKGAALKGTAFERHGLESTALKGRGFSRAVSRPKSIAALAA